MTKYEETQIKILEKQTEFNRILALATNVLALGVTIQILFYLISPDFKIDFSNLDWFQIICAILLLLFAIFLIGHMIKFVVELIRYNKILIPFKIKKKKQTFKNS